MQSQAFKWISYKTLTRRLQLKIRLFFGKHAIINPMTNHHEHVWLIENEAELASLIAEGALIPLGYTVDIFESASAALEYSGKTAPDVIITELDLPGLSGKDLMIGLASQGSTVPIIVIADKGQETDVLQAIRLGAEDFLIRPIREAEVSVVVEKTLSSKRTVRRVELLAKTVDESKILLELEQGDFSEILSFCKLVLSNRGLQSFADQLTSLALHLSQADCAWLSIYDENQLNFKLQACQNVPNGVQTNLDKPYVDELSSLVAASGQPVSLHGDTLNRFKAFEPFGAAMVVPVIHDNKDTSIIVVARNEAEPFNNYQQAMLELVAEFTAAALVNERRFKQVEHLLVMLQQANIYAYLESNIKYDLLRQASLELRTPLKYLMESVDALLDKDDRRLNEEQNGMLNAILEQAEILMDIADSMINYRQAEAIRLETVDLNDIVRNTANRFRPIAQMGKIAISLELPAQPTLVKVYPAQITKALEGLLSNALKYSPQNGEVSVVVGQEEDNVNLSVSDQGNGIDEGMAEQIFDIKSSVFGYTPKRFGGIGISLPRIKEIISAYNGRIWVEPTQGIGFKIVFSIPCQARPVS
jgi:K+-sensing histidine kinase KdpD